MKYQLKAANYISSIDRSIEADSDAEAIYKAIVFSLYTFGREKDDGLDTYLTSFKLTYKNEVIYAVNGTTKEILKSIIASV